MERKEQAERGPNEAVGEEQQQPSVFKSMDDFQRAVFPKAAEVQFFRGHEPREVGEQIGRLALVRSRRTP